MAWKTNGVIPNRVRPANLVFGYDAKQSDPDHRVSVCPDSFLLTTLGVSAAARGVLLTIFMRYWRYPCPEPVEEELVRAELRTRRDVLRRALDELVRAEVIERVPGGVVPTGAFGAHERDPAKPRARRDMPAEWVGLREAVFARDGYSCVYCGSGADLHCDHVDPVALGGSHDMSNLVTACATCNLSKGSKTVAEWRPDIAAAMRR